MFEPWYHSSGRFNLRTEQWSAFLVTELVAIACMITSRDVVESLFKAFMIWYLKCDAKLEAIWMPRLVQLFRFLRNAVEKSKTSMEGQAWPRTAMSEDEGTTAVGLTRPGEKRNASSTAEC